MDDADRILDKRPGAYRAHLDGLGASWQRRGPAEVVGHYGDAAAEWRFVRQQGGLGLMDRSERDVLVLSGEDAAAWLQGLVTNDVRALAEPGAGQWTQALNNHGRLIADMRLWHMPDVLIADLEGGLLSQGILAHLRRHVIREKVRLSDRSALTGRVGLFGRGATALLSALAHTEVPVARCPVWGGTWGDLGGVDVVIQRVHWTGEEGFEVACDVEDTQRVWQALQESCSPEQLRPLGHEAFEWLRLEAGVGRWGVELDDRVIPLEAGLNPAISYTKGCYLGQEIIARLDTRGVPARLLRTLALEDPGADVRPGMPIFHGNARAGELVSVMPAIAGLGALALGYVKREHNALGTFVQLGGPEGPESLAARIEPLGWGVTRHAVSRSPVAP